MLAAVVLALVGFAVGPMLAVVVDRAVGRERLRSEHRCVHCRHGLGVASLAPLRSWVASCAHCGRRPGWRYPLTDVSAAAAFALVGARFGFTGETLIHGALAAVLVVLADIATRDFVGVETVRSHVKGVLRKLAVGSQLEAVAMAYRAGWRHPDPVSVS